MSEDRERRRAGKREGGRGRERESVGGKKKDMCREGESLNMTTGKSEEKNTDRKERRDKTL